MDTSRKNNKSPYIALVSNGELLCPKCGAVLCKAHYGAYGSGIEIKCRSRGCKIPILIEI